MIKVHVGSIVTGQKEAIVDPATTTLRQVLEENHVEYATGMTQLDGCTLQPGELDKTFGEFGITGKCYLLVVMKQANAAKVLVLGGAAVVRSGIPLSMIEEVSRYKPDYLTRYEYDDDGKRIPEFAVCATTDGKGSLSEYGAAFSANGSTEGEGVITLDIPDGVTDRAEYIKKMYGKALVLLNDMEEHIRNDYEGEIKPAIDKVSTLIEVL